ncbi:hypothetical protein B1748_30795 [Paenibacillus sp. MY03]|nr:hypothetical protein B1748_30795 [Paenibacillus sp. MY03]
MPACISFGQKKKDPTMSATALPLNLWLSSRLSMIFCLRTFLLGSSFLYLALVYDAFVQVSIIYFIFPIVFVGIKKSAKKMH